MKNLFNYRHLVNECKRIKKEKEANHRLDYDKTLYEMAFPFVSDTYEGFVDDCKNRFPGMDKLDYMFCDNYEVYTDVNIDEKDSYDKIVNEIDTYKDYMKDGYCSIVVDDYSGDLKFLFEYDKF